MRNNIFIPQKIKVGFQTRSDTYTQQLAYVIYYDEKGKLRKENSWESWRDKKIDPAEYDNIPTEGFVLNKKVGGYAGDWGNFRQAYVRVYDPRGFEFEITIPNLLYILEQTSSIKGKGLEGEFVYAWDGTDLVLLPTCAPDYEDLTQLNNKRFANETIKAKDLKIGATYLTKDNNQWIYMGRFDYYDDCYEFDGQRFTGYTKMCNYASKNGKKLFHEERRDAGYSWGWDRQRVYDYESVIGVVGKYHYFYTGNRFIGLPSSAGKLIEVISADPAPNYAELFEQLEHDIHYSPYDESKDQYIPATFEEFQRVDGYGHSCLIKTSLGYEDLSLRPVEWGNPNTLWRCEKNNRPFVPDGMDTEEVKISSYSSATRTQMVPSTLAEIFSHIDVYHRDQYLANGKFYRRLY